MKWGSTGVYTEDAAGHPVYNWTILDRIFDTYLERGVRPYAQIGFMPKALSIKPEPYQHRWTPAAPLRRDLYRLGLSAEGLREVGGTRLPVGADIASERYGAHEVEPVVLGGLERAEHRLLARHAGRNSSSSTTTPSHAVRRALAHGPVGGPDTAGSGGSFMRDFLEHCLRGTNYATGKIGTPLDFVSFHAKGAPQFVDGHVRMGIANHLRTIDEGFASSRPIRS